MRMQPKQAEARHAGARNGRELFWALGSFRSQSAGNLLDPETWAPPPLSHWPSCRVRWADSHLTLPLPPTPTPRAETGAGKKQHPSHPDLDSDRGARKTPQTWLPVLPPPITAVLFVIYEMQVMMASMRITVPDLAASRLT